MFYKCLAIAVLVIGWMICLPSYAAKTIYYHKGKPAFLLTNNPSDNKSYLQYFPAWFDTQGQRYFVFNPKKLAFAIYNNQGFKIGAGKAVGGANFCRDTGRACKTVRGTFTVYSKGSKYHRSSRYPRPNGGAPMPYAMHFYKGYAVHGSNALPNINASHGCVRVETQTAAWLSQNFMQKGTKVRVLPY